MVGEEAFDFAVLEELEVRVMTDLLLQFGLLGGRCLCRLLFGLSWLHSC